MLGNQVCPQMLTPNCFNKSFISDQRATKCDTKGREFSLHLSQNHSVAKVATIVVHVHCGVYIIPVEGQQIEIYWMEVLDPIIKWRLWLLLDFYLSVISQHSRAANFWGF